MCRSPRAKITPDIIVLSHLPANDDEEKKCTDGKPFQLRRNITIDQIRRMQRRLTTRPTLGRRRAIIIDPADDMEKGAVNALLKSLEEPPSGTFFLLVAHRPGRLLATVVLSALLAEGAPIMVQARQLGLNVPVIGGNGMNSVKVFDLAKGASDNLWVGSPWSIENRTKENNSFIVAFTLKYKSTPDQFAAQAYDALHIAVAAIKKVKLSGDLTKDRAALRDALPDVKWTGATGGFVFRRAKDKSGNPAGYDAQQLPIISVTKGNNYVIVK